MSHDLSEKRHGKACQNTDRELWRERPDDYYADSLHVTEGGGIGINHGGRVIVLPLWRWHELAMNEFGAIFDGGKSPADPAIGKSVDAQPSIGSAPESSSLPAQWPEGGR